MLFSVLDFRNLHNIMIPFHIADWPTCVFICSIFLFIHSTFSLIVYYYDSYYLWCCCCGHIYYSCRVDSCIKGITSVKPRCWYASFSGCKFSVPSCDIFNVGFIIFECRTHCLYDVSMCFVFRLQVFCVMELWSHCKSIWTSPCQVCWLMLAVCITF